MHMADNMYKSWRTESGAASWECDVMHYRSNGSAPNDNSGGSGISSEGE